MIDQSGYLTLIRKNSGKLTDEDFHRARREGVLDQLLASLDTDHIHGPQKNLVLACAAPFWFQLLFNAATVGVPLDGYNGTNSALLGHMGFTTDDAEPTLTEWSYEYTDRGISAQDYVTNGVATNCCKGFEEYQAEADEIKSDPGGRESIYYRERWLFAPSECISSNIRTFMVYGSPSAVDYTGWKPRLRMSRIRLKDANGLPVIYSKTANQILLAEYKFVLASV